MVDLLVQGPALEFRLATGWFKAVDSHLAFKFGELEADQLLAAVRDRGLLPINNDRVGFSRCFVFCHFQVGGVGA